ncbi:NfeD family protein [Oceanisphaera pacifica]|uniref:NfeD family protein n=1 Tax=Oceanisphaera pacifica TaxID=2818389 RepID=A0ABS3NDY4_9GAMM|nr:NfeD family protein [Oceanisphaera pacifica]MBO1518804.1 NfeD family protein [Oceanisphaera pacifica]
MLAWHGWLIAALVLLLLELTGTGFIAFALGLAALITMAAAWLNIGLSAQWFIFAISALILAPVLKYLFRRYAPSKRTSFLAGEAQQYGEIVQLDSGDYRLKLEADLFMVRSQSGAKLTVGSQVKILRFDGITAIIA